MTMMRTAWPDRITWIVGLTTTIGLSSQSAVSWMVDALAKTGGLSIQQASLMSTAEMLALGITMIVLAPVIHRLAHKRLLLLSTLAVLVAQALSSLVHGFVPMGLTRILSGVAFGAIYAIATVSGAAADNPESAYANGAGINMVLGMFLNPPLGFGSEHFGHRGVFVGLGLYCLVLAIPLLFIAFPQPIIAAPVERKARVAATLFDGWMVVGLMAVMGMFAIATNGVYVFFVDVASRAGLTGTILGEDLVLVSFSSAVTIALLGRLGAWLGPRLRAKDGEPARGRAVFASLLVMGAVSWMFMKVPNPLAFTIAFSVWCSVYWIAYTFILGLAVAIDPLGRLAAASGSALILFGGLGSAAAGFVAEHFGSALYGIFALAACIVAGLLGIWVAAALASRPRRPPALAQRIPGGNSA